MRSHQEILDNPKVTVYRAGEDGGAGYVQVGRRYADSVNVIWSFGGGWDHVSVGRSDAIIPTWDDMCEVKRLFFDDSETVVQFHPKAAEYVNVHPAVLHLWKPQGEEIKLPPRLLI